MDRVIHGGVVITSGVFINVFSDYAQLKGLAVSAAATGGLAAATWLRRRPQAPISRHGARMGSILALAGALAAALAPAGLTGLITLMAVAVAATSLAVQPDVKSAVRLLFRMLTTGLAIASFGAGIHLLFGNFAIVGLFSLLVGATSLTCGQRVDAVFKDAAPKDFAWEFPASDLMNERFGFLAIASAFTLVHVGLQLVALGRGIGGALLLAGSICCGLAAAATIWRRPALFASAVIGFGLTLAAEGVSWTFDARSALFGVVGIVLGAMISGFALGYFRESVTRLHQKLRALFKEPETTAAASDG